MAVDQDTLDSQAFGQLQSLIMQDTMRPSANASNKKLSQNKRKHVDAQQALPPGSAPEARDMADNDQETDPRAAATFTAFSNSPDGDTQPMPSQVYREYINAANQGGQASVGEDGPDLMAYMDTQFSVPGLPASRQIHSLEESLDDDMTGDLLSSMRKEPVPYTPGLAGHKRHRNGDTVTPSTYSKTPGTTLSNIFGQRSMKPLLTATQLFENTQAASSPIQAGLVSDPLDSRPSPDFAHHADYSPSAGGESSPTKQIYTDPPNVDGPRDIYKSVDESQRARQQLLRKNLRPPTSSKVLFDDSPIEDGPEQRTINTTQLQRSIFPELEQSPIKESATPVEEPETRHEDEDAVIELSDNVSSSEEEEESVYEYDEYSQNVYASQGRNSKRISASPEIEETRLEVAGSPAITDSNMHQTSADAPQHTNEFLTVANTQQSRNGTSYPPRPVEPSSLSSIVPGSQVVPASSQTRAAIQARIDQEKSSSLPLPPVTSQAPALASHVPSSPPVMDRVEDAVDSNAVDDATVIAEADGAPEQGEAEVEQDGPASGVEMAEAQPSRPVESNATTLYTTAASHVSNSQLARNTASQIQQSSTESPVKVAKARRFADMEQSPPPDSQEQIDISVGLEAVVNSDHDYLEALRPPTPPPVSVGNGRLKALKNRKFRDRMAGPATPNPRAIYKEGTKKLQAHAEQTDEDEAPKNLPKRRKLFGGRKSTIEETPQQPSTHKNTVPEPDEPSHADRESVAERQIEMPSETPVAGGRKRKRRGTLALEREPSPAISAPESTRAAPSEAGEPIAEQAAAPIATDSATRVLALFNGSVTGYYPATCLSASATASGTRYTVRFDDDSNTTLDAHHVCAFSVVPGDVVKIDLPKMRTNMYIIHAFPSEQASGVTDIHGHTTVQVRLKRTSARGRVAANIAAIDRPVSVPVGSLYVTQSMWSRFETRTYVHPSGIIPAGTPSISTRATPALTSALFANMAFAVSFSSASPERDTLAATLLSHGARVLDGGFHDLFAPSRDGLLLRPESQNLGFVALLADAASRNQKYIQALSLGLPTISHRWVRECVRRGQVLGWGRYALPAGQSTLLGTVRSRTLAEYPVEGEMLRDRIEARRRLMPAADGGEGVVLLPPPVAGGRRKSEARRADKREVYAFLGMAMGANKVEMADGVDEAVKLVKSGGWGWVHCDQAQLLDVARAIGKDVQEDAEDAEGEVLSLIVGGTRVVCDEWVIQRLILGA